MAPRKGHMPGPRIASFVSTFDKQNVSAVWSCGTLSQNERNSCFARVGICLSELGIIGGKTLSDFV